MSTIQVHLSFREFHHILLGSDSFRDRLWLTNAGAMMRRPEIQSHFVGTPRMHDLIPLQMVGAGQHGRIEELVGSADHVHRLEEMGLRRGTCFEVVKSGSPCIVRVAGHKLAIRDGDLFGVLVRAEERG